VVGWFFVKGLDRRVTLQRVGGHHLLTPHPQLVNSASASTGKGPDYFLDLLKQFNLPV